MLKKKLPFRQTPVWRFLHPLLLAVGILAVFVGSFLAIKEGTQWLFHFSERDAIGMAMMFSMIFIFGGSLLFLEGNHSEKSIVQDNKFSYVRDRLRVNEEVLIVFTWFNNRRYTSFSGFVATNERIFRIKNSEVKSYIWYSQDTVITYSSLSKKRHFLTYFVIAISVLIFLATVRIWSIYPVYAGLTIPGIVELALTLFVDPVRGSYSIEDPSIPISERNKWVITPTDLQSGNASKFVLIVREQVSKLGG